MKKLDPIDIFVPLIYPHGLVRTRAWETTKDTWILVLLRRSPKKGRGESLDFVSLEQRSIRTFTFQGILVDFLLES